MAKNSLDAFFEYFKCESTEDYHDRQAWASTCCLNEKEQTALILEIIRLLNHIPLSQAYHLLEEAKGFLLDFHTVDPRNPRYVKKFAEAEEFSRSTCIQL